MAIKKTVPSTYLPQNLSRNDKKQQKNELKKSQKLYKKGIYHTRKKVSSFKSKVSPHILNAMKMYNVKVINSNSQLSKSSGCSKEGLEKIISKGRGAYYSSGSRPNQTAESWGRARLASAITGGNASITDYHILNDYCKPNSKPIQLAKHLMKKKGKTIKRFDKVQLGGKTAQNETVPKELKFKDYPEFKPNLTPRQVLLLGSFGGTYYRPIKSRVTNKSYKNQHSEFKDMWKGIPLKNITSPNYDEKINLYGVKCGLSLIEWEDYGWITKLDPYGWFQWYCRFFKGRRNKTEDRRQIDRWLKFASRDQGRFRKNLVTHILKNNGKYSDSNIVPKIRQGLQHWGYQITKKDFDYEVNHRNKKS